MEQPIHSRVDRHHLLALYTSRGTLDPMRSPATRPFRLAFGWATAIAFGLMVIGNVYQQAAWLIAFGAVVLLGALLLLLYAFSHVWRSRYRVRKWARSVEAQGPESISWGDNGFSIVHDGKEHVTTWGSITKLDVYEDHFFVKADQDHLFPKAGMTAEQFTYLVDLFRQKTLSGGSVTSG